VENRGRELLMQSMDIKLTINTKKYEMTVDVRKSLMDLLRELGYTSVKHGCGVGECGACTVLVDDIAIDSCLYLATWANNTEIRTTEGECRDGKLSPVQDAYVEEGAVQCGFCTPGLIMTTTSFLEKNRGKIFPAKRSKGSCRKSLPLHRIPDHYQCG